METKSVFESGFAGWLRYAVLAVLSCFVMTSTSLAQETATGGQRFEDWVVHCDTKEKTRANCIMSQMAVVNDTGERLMRINIRYIPRQEETKMQFVLPLGISLHSDPQLHLDGVYAQDVVMDLCLIDGCYATFMLTGEILEKFLAMYTGELHLKTGSGEAMVIPISGGGSRAAWNAMRNMAQVLDSRIYPGISDPGDPE